MKEFSILPLHIGFRVVLLTWQSNERDVVRLNWFDLDQSCSEVEHVMLVVLDEQLCWENTISATKQTKQTQIQTNSKNALLGQLWSRIDLNVIAGKITNLLNTYLESQSRTLLALEVSERVRIVRGKKKERNSFVLPYEIIILKRWNRKWDVYWLTNDFTIFKASPTNNQGCFDLNFLVTCHEFSLAPWLRDNNRFCFRFRLSPEDLWAAETI